MEQHTKSGENKGYVLTIILLIILASIVIAAYVYSPPKMLRILLSHQRAEHALTEHLNQDGLENYFAQQRVRALK